MNNLLKVAIDLHVNGKIEEAKSIYLSIEKDILNNKDLETLFANLANIYYAQDNKFDAINYYKKANKINENSKTNYNIGVSYLLLDDYINAKIYFKNAIHLDNKYIKAYINLGITYKKNDEALLSIPYFKRALTLNDTDPDITYNYANSLLSLEKFTQTINLLERTLSLDIKYEKAYYTLGLTYQKLGKYEKALIHFNEAIKLNENYSDAHFAKSTILLIMGDYENGWKEYYYRWDAKNHLNRPLYNVKWWNGEDLKGKRILVQQEQGFGDNIQFVRFVPLLYSLGATVYLAVKDELYDLFKSLDNINLVRDKDTVDNVDYFTSLMELPRLLYDKNNQFVTSIKYLNSKNNCNNILIKDKKKINVGFVWQGNKNHSGDKKRSISLEEFEPLFLNNNFNYYSLQFEDDEKIELKKYISKYKNIFDVTDGINDFNDTSNFIKKLDFVITIDSAMVHLCGSLGVKCFLLLHKHAEWRWLLNTDKSPWYESITILRQTNIKSFNKLFESKCFITNS